jgi:hypothetical protein
MKRKEFQQTTIEARRLLLQTSMAMNSHSKFCRLESPAKEEIRSTTELSAPKMETDFFIMISGVAGE